MSHRPLSWLILGTVVLWTGSPAPSAAPLWQRLLEGQGTPRDHLRLAEAHARAGRCGAAVFHFRMYLKKGSSPLLRKRVLERIRACRRTAGWIVPKRRSAARPVLVLARASEPTVWVLGGRIRIGSTTAERQVARDLCQQRSFRHDVRLCRKLRFSRERKATSVRVKGFRIQRTEVSWERYLRCVRAGACRRPPARFATPADAQRPVSGVTWSEARAYCRWRGGRLPRESEWVAAGRGSALPVRVWPWGRHAVQWCAQHARLAAGPGAAVGSARVGAHRCDASPFGVLDLAGNVREWVAADAGAGSGHRAASERIARGGSFRQPEWQARLAARWLLPATTRRDDLGFRCVVPRAGPGRGQGR